MRTCPFCAEEIQDAAIKCKHCGEMIAAADGERAKAIRATTLQTPLSRAAAGLFAFVGLWVLLLGLSEWYGGSSTQNMYRGTILQSDPNAKRITSNVISSGIEKVVIGGVLLAGAIIVSLVGTRSVAGGPNTATPARPSKPAMSVVERIAIGVGIFFAVLFGVPLLLLILGLIG